MVPSSRTLSEQPGGQAARLVGRRWRRVVRAVVMVVAVLVVVWWRVPLRFSAPASTEIEKGDTISMGGTIPPYCTTYGHLRSAGLRGRAHQWVATLAWVRTDPATRRATGVQERVEVGLGESVHIDRLGTVTLLAVNPWVLVPQSGMGGWSYRVNVALDPGVSKTPCY